MPASGHHYIGRFAPSPTGLLHMGSLIGALASFLDARANNGQWLLRMEDLDPPREIAGAATNILNSLQRHGLHWDDEVIWQSQRHPAYQQAIAQLLEQQQAFYCSCSRRELQNSNGIHRGNCSQRYNESAQASAIRVIAPKGILGFEDAIQGGFHQQLASEVGDYVIRRKDQLFAYQLAVVVDDAWQGISHIVRGCDLLDSTPRQIHLQQLLKLPTPKYAHIPLLTNDQGQKLSKQSFAAAIDSDNACSNLLVALRFLQQQVPPTSAQQRVEDILNWAIEHWSIQAIPRTQAISQTTLGFA